MAAFGAAVLSRLVFVALLDTTQFTTDEARYQLPTHAVMMAAAVVGAALFADIALTWARNRNHAAPELTGVSESAPESLLTPPHHAFADSDADPER